MPLLNNHFASSAPSPATRFAKVLPDSFPMGASAGIRPSCFKLRMTQKVVMPSRSTLSFFSIRSNVQFIVVCVPAQFPSPPCPKIGCWGPPCGPQGLTVEQSFRTYCGPLREHTLLAPFEFRAPIILVKLLHQAEHFCRLCPCSGLHTLLPITVETL